jgi:hypothetical protein
MTVRWRGHNSFYDGWLAKIYNQPLDPAKDEAWKAGWCTADETDRLHLFAAFGQEVLLGTNIEPVSRHAPELHELIGQPWFAAAQDLAERAATILQNHGVRGATMNLTGGRLVIDE